LHSISVSGKKQLFNQKPGGSPPEVCPMPRSVPITLVALCLTGATLHARSFQPATNRPELAGVWLLNEEMSNDVPALPGEATNQARETGLLPRASFGKKPRNGLDLYEVARVRTALRDWFEASARLTFRTSGAALAITDARGRTMELVPGGKPITVVHGSVAAEMRGEWDGPALVIQRRYPDRTVMTESLSTFVAPRQLVVTSTVVNPRIAEPAALLTRVYDYVGGGESSR
jgi:hypothetical protein